MLNKALTTNIPEDLLYQNIFKALEGIKIMKKRKIKMSPDFFKQVRTQADIYRDDTRVPKFWGLEVEIDKDLKEDYQIVEEEE